MSESSEISPQVQNVKLQIDKVSEPSKTKPSIEYDKLPEKHRSIISREIKELADRGIDFELNYRVACATWQEIRRARGMIMQSLSDDAMLKDEYKYTGDKVSEKLSSDEIDRLCNLVTMVSLSNGVLFWTKDLKPDNKLLAMHTKSLERIREMTAQIHNPDEYSRFGHVQVMYTINEWIINYFEHGISQSDNLGDHFATHGEPHVFLDGISVDALKKQIEEDPTTIVVLAPAASSGVLEAGIFAHYMSEKLQIPTTIDPVFFSKGYDDREPINVINSTLPIQKRIVIPLDDRIISSGYSPLQAKLGAERKYGRDSLVMSNRLQKLSAAWEDRKRRKATVPIIDNSQVRQVSQPDQPVLESKPSATSRIGTILKSTLRRFGLSE